jgi:hypothetical protein
MSWSEGSSKILDVSSSSERNVLAVQSSEGIHKQSAVLLRLIQHDLKLLGAAKRITSLYKSLISICLTYVDPQGHVRIL